MDIANALYSTIFWFGLIMLLFVIIVLSRQAQIIFGTFVGLTYSIFLSLLDALHVLDKQKVVDWTTNKINKLKEMAKKDI